ncbi:MAG: SLBB domain-containing protein, partial [Spirochaetia bacterium]|nr:SLBB domain-containing protein [Spirochaetia bacterium]
PDGEKLVFDISAAQLPELKNGDVLRVPGTDEYLPIVYVEGAVAGDQLALSGKDATVTQTNYSIIRAQFKKGLTVAALLRPLREKILSSADLAQAFIIRNGTDKQTAVNLERLLYANDLHYDFELQPEDRVVIPFGSMYVFVAGEVTKSSWVGITGLTRLRDVVLPLVTRYSSIRDVVVRSVDGFEKTYDLFRADRYGDLSQDPFLRPGEEVRVSRLNNLVTIQGEVRRPGTYQLLPGEGLKELIEVYADGFTEKANSTRISLLHYLSETSPVGEKVQFDYAQNTNIKLNLYDVISVPSMQELLPVIWFEGAVGAGATAGTSPETSERSAYNFYPGETISQAVLASRKLFSAVSDIRNAYVLHADGTRKAIDLAKFLYDYDLSGDFALQSNDIIIVPFRQFFVTVSGAVKSPGRYPYIPDRTWEYYVGLAGGFDTERNAGQQIVVYDAKSNKVASAGRMIQPEDNIEAASNSFTYKFFRFSSILTTVLSVVALVINLLKL